MEFSRIAKLEIKEIKIKKIFFKLTFATYQEMFVSHYNRLSLFSSLAYIMPPMVEIAFIYLIHNKWLKKCLIYNLKASKYCVNTEHNQHESCTVCTIYKKQTGFFFYKV